MDGREPVEVWCAVTRRWVGGYELIATSDGGIDDGAVRVRRTGSDELPEPLRVDLVRRAQRGPAFWSVPQPTRTRRPFW